MNRRMIPLLAAVLLTGALCTTASANLAKEIRLTVPILEQLPNDAHLVFMNTGGIKAVESKSPYITSIVPVGEAIDITFNAKLAAGTEVVFNIDVTQDDPKLSFVSGDWTNDGNIIAPILAAHVVILRKFPGASPAGLILLSLVILGSGIFVLRRRGTATA